MTDEHHGPGPACERVGAVTADCVAPDRIKPGWFTKEEATMSVAKRPSRNGDRGDVVDPPSRNGDRSDEEFMSQLAAGRPEALGPLHGRDAALVYGLAARS